MQVVNKKLSETSPKTSSFARTKVGARQIEERKRFELRLSIGQLVSVWVILAVCLGLVFSYGVSTGRKIGLRAALDSKRTDIVRLPVIPSSDLPIARSAQDSITRESTRPVSLSPDVPAATPAQVGAEKNGETFDFRPNVEPPVPSAPPPAGFAAKPAQGALASSSAAQEAIQELKMTPTVPVGWYIQIVAARTEKEATELGNSLIQNGYITTVQTAPVGAQMYYRVLVGPFSEKELANNTFNRLRLLPNVSSAAFLKLVE